MYIEEDRKTLSHPIFTKALYITAGVLAGFLISRIFFQTFTVSSNSMMPDLEKGDRLVVFKTISPEPGDIVLFYSPLEPDRIMVKRLFALGGDVIEIKDKAVYKNSEMVLLPWPTLERDRRAFPEQFTGRDNLPAAKIKKGDCFVIGDNLDYSFDSRDFGPFSTDNIIGKVIFKY